MLKQDKKRLTDSLQSILKRVWAESAQNIAIASAIGGFLTALLAAVFQFGLSFLWVLLVFISATSITLFFILNRGRKRLNSITFKKSLVFRPAEPLGLRKSTKLKGEELAGDQEILYLSRKNVVLTLEALCCKQNLTILSGDSGSGKTSLLHAGLLPILAGKLICVSVKSGFENIHNTLWRMVVSELRIQTNIKPEHEDSPYDELIKSLKIIDQETLIIFDQVEQLFIHSYQKDVQVFFERLRNLVTDSGLRCRALIVIRREWFTHLIPLRDLINGFDGHCFLDPLTKNEAMDTINCMFDVSRNLNLQTDIGTTKFEPKLIETIVEDLALGEVRGINPIELQCICSTLELLGKNTQDEYLMLGSKDGVIREFFEIVNNELTKKENILSWRLFLALGYEQNGRWALTEDQLRRLTFQEKHDGLRRVLDHFVEQGIIVCSSEGRYEFAHDFLATLCRDQAELRLSGEIVANTDFVIRTTTEKMGETQRGKSLQEVCNSWPSRNFLKTVWILIILLSFFQISRLFLWQPSHWIDPLKILQFSVWHIGYLDIVILPAVLSSIVAGVFVGLLITGPLRYIPGIQKQSEVTIPFFVLFVYLICVILGCTYWYSWIPLAGILTSSMAFGFWILATKYKNSPQVSEKFNDYAKTLMINALFLFMGGVGFVAGVSWYLTSYSAGLSPNMAPIVIVESIVGGLITFGLGFVWNRDFRGVNRNDWQGMRWIGEVVFAELRKYS
jgi:Novel STAND NTPase 1